jgi:hypothetical protein
MDAGAAIRVRFRAGHLYKAVCKYGMKDYESQSGGVDAPKRVMSHYYYNCHRKASLLSLVSMVSLDPPSTASTSAKTSKTNYTTLGQ